MLMLILHQLRYRVGVDPRMLCLPKPSAKQTHGKIWDIVVIKLDCLMEGWFGAWIGKRGPVHLRHVVISFARSLKCFPNRFSPNFPIVMLITSLLWVLFICLHFPYRGTPESVPHVRWFVRSSVGWTVIYNRRRRPDQRTKMIRTDIFIIELLVSIDRFDYFPLLPCLQTRSTRWRVIFLGTGTTH